LKEEIEKEEVMRLIEQVAKQNKIIKMLTKQYNVKKFEENKKRKWKKDK